jgi:hypothetical protein
MPLKDRQFGHPVRDEGACVSGCGDIVSTFEIGLAPCRLRAFSILRARSTGSAPIIVAT